MKRTFLSLACIFFFACISMILARDWTNVDVRMGVAAKFTVKVVDETGTPVEGAKVWARFSLSSLGKFTVDEKVTNKEGCVEVAGLCDLYTRFVIIKDGYYETAHTIEYDKDGYDIKDGKFQPYGGVVQYTLKKVHKPTRMHFFDDFRFKVPQADQEYGFDMACGALVEPYGKGKVADFYIKYTFSDDDGIFCKTMTISFPNNLDGAYLISLDTDSVFQSSYHADLNGQYIKTFTLKYARNFKWQENVHSGKKSRTFIGNTPLCNESLARNQCLIFRTRTKVDATGNLVSAHYGKIYGEINLAGSLMGTKISSEALIFFNPVENNTSLEYDNREYWNFVEQTKGQVFGGLFAF